MTIKELEFTLENPIKVDVSGQKKECTNIILQAPSNRVRRQCDKLRNRFMLAIQQLNQSSQSTGSSDGDAKKGFTSKEIIAFLTMYCDDYVSFCDDFESLVTNGVAEVEGIKLNQKLFSDISYDDSQNMMGVYLENFIVGSLMSGLLAK